MTDPPIHLQAGPFTAVFYQGDVRYLAVAGQELVRRVYVTVRDTRWGTLLPVIRNLRLTRGPDGFTAAYDADYAQEEIGFASHVTISGQAAGDVVRVTVELSGRAGSTFQTNRTGLCLLHPIEGLAGVTGEVEHVDGSTTTAPFPDTIAPDAPFSDIRIMRYQTPQASTRITFEGEPFETEDQRNWSDASYKTYCRTLAMPRPYELRQGDEVRQRIVIEITAASSPPPAIDETLRLGGCIGRPPRLGVQVNEVPGTAVLQALRLLPLAFLRHDVRPAVDPAWCQRLHAFAALGWPVEAALHVREEGDLPDAGLLPANLCRLLVFRDGAAMTDADLAAAARSRYPQVSVGGETIANFTELNRNRPAPGLLDALAYAVTPQVHAMDDLSIMENLAAQAAAVQTARGFAPGVPLSVGPVTLHRRPDPFAAGNDGRAAAATPDPRHASHFGAAWTVGSLKYLAEAGADAVTYYDAAGPHGLMSDDGRPYPLYRVFADLADFADGEVVAISNPQPLHYAALAVRKDGRTRLLVANTGWAEVAVSIAGHGQLRLPPHGTTALDLEET